MKIDHALIRETSQTHGTRAFSTAKGYELSYEAGTLTVRTPQSPSRIYYYPASAIVEMWAEAEPSKKK
jgi:hypothetical protein